MLTRRAFAGVGLGAVAAGLPRPTLAQGKQVVRIGLPTRAYWPAIPVHVAKDLGFYDKEGLAAEITIYNSGGASVEAVAAGACDIIAAAPASVAAARVRGVKARIVAGGSQTPSGFYLMVKSDSPFRTVADLAGKNLGITAAGSTTDFLALWAMDHRKVKMTKVAVGGGALVPNLLSGQLDAIVAYPPLGYSLLTSGNGRVVLDFGAEMEPSLPDTWVAAEAIIDKRPEVVEATLRAIFGALQYLQKNRDYGLKFVQSFTQLAPAVAQMEYERTLLSLPPNGELKRQWLEASMRLARLAGIAALPEVDDMFSSRFTPLNKVTAP